MNDSIFYPSPSRSERVCGWMSLRMARLFAPRQARHLYIVSQSQAHSEL